MEKLYTTSAFQWTYDQTQGRRIVPPTDDELVQLKDPEGNEVTQPDGTPVMVPPPGWQPTVEEVSLDTIVVIDVNQEGTPSGTLFRLAFAKDALARFLATYVEHLDIDGRQVLRNALEQASPVDVPEIALNREQRRHLKLAE